MSNNKVIGMWESLELIVEIEIDGVRFQRRKDGEIYHWGEWDNEYHYWKILSNTTKWPSILSHIASLERVRDALELVLPLAKGYAPPNQTDAAKQTCRGWINQAEKALKDCHEREHPKSP